MNKERILEVADAIENHKIADLGFNMNYEYCEGVDDKSGHSCGTVACILGWTHALYGKRGDTNRRHAADLLGIEYATADKLFYPSDVVKFEEVTPSEAAETLRILAETGRVDWSNAQGFGDYSDEW